MKKERRRASILWRVLTASRGIAHAHASRSSRGKIGMKKTFKTRCENDVSIVARTRQEEGGQEMSLNIHYNTGASKAANAHAQTREEKRMRRRRRKNVKESL